MMRRSSPGFFLSLLLSAFAFGCGSDEARAPLKVASDASVDGSPEPPKEDSGQPATGGCGPATCKSGCCAQGQCVDGTAPAQCGNGGLACVDCTPLEMGCVNRGCGMTTCTNCDGCCKAGTCNTNGKSQDNACGKAGEICVDCTASGRTCNGNGFCI